MPTRRGFLAAVLGVAALAAWPFKRAWVRPKSPLPGQEVYDLPKGCEGTGFLLCRLATVRYSCGICNEQYAHRVWARTEAGRDDEGERLMKAHVKECAARRRQARTSEGMLVPNVFADDIEAFLERPYLAAVEARTAHGLA